MSDAEPFCLKYFKHLKHFSRLSEDGQTLFRFRTAKEFYCLPKYIVYWLKLWCLFFFLFIYFFTWKIFCQLCHNSQQRAKTSWALPHHCVNVNKIFYFQGGVISRSPTDSFLHFYLLIFVRVYQKGIVCLFFFHIK